MNIVSIIEKKRDKKELTKEEIEYFVNEYTKGNIPDYQASALIMAIYLNGMNRKETSDLTMVMAESGDKLDLSDISDLIIDKHSTGGVGDKITIILMPIIAALGIPVAKMSGRGLGFTGGTADKLESIPGYNVDLSIEEFKENVKKIGISLITSNLNLAPADKKIYALRDTIGCVSSIPLIASSIMSKKIAAGGNKIVIDLTCGSGAFMKNIIKAAILARTMVSIGNSLDKEVRCVLTNMDEPVGYSVGNQLEIIEAVKALKGEMTDDVKEITYALGAQILIMAGKVEDEQSAVNIIKEVIDSGKAFEKFKELVANQGGDISYIEDVSKFENAKYVVPVYTKRAGNVVKINTEKIGKASVLLGAGRTNKEDKIDFQAGIIINKKINDIVRRNEPVAYIYTNKEDSIEEASKLIQSSYILLNIKRIKRRTVLQIIK
ncbi:MAG: thymidine phosphorylase [Clostridia bacterium]|nr:thymidine phosphorylase [Clostridia bacterium]